MSTTRRNLGLVVGCVLLATRLTVPCAADAPEGLGELEGEWLATESKAKTGSCASPRKNRLDRDHRKRHSTFRYPYLIEPSDDGGFVILPADPEEREGSLPWKGVIERDGTVQTTRTHSSYCDGSSHSAEVSYDGRLKRGHKGSRIVLSGRLRLCPTSGCVYRVKIVLAKQN